MTQKMFGLLPTALGRSNQALVLTSAMSGVTMKYLRLTFVTSKEAGSPPRSRAWANEVRFRGCPHSF